jgi:predicted RNA-binding protein with PUA-like domain
MNYWLMKSEPATFGIEHLQAAAAHTHCWDGVRNYQVRNFIRDKMAIGDLAFFYHSNCKTPGIVGIMTIATDSYPDPTAFDPDSKYFDPKSHPDKVRWLMRDVKLVEKFRQIISLQNLRAETELADMLILRPGNRLSITPLTSKQWQVILRMAEQG